MPYCFSYVYRITNGAAIVAAIDVNQDNSDWLFSRAKHEGKDAVIKVNVEFQKVLTCSLTAVRSNESSD